MYRYPLFLYYCILYFIRRTYIYLLKNAPLILCQMHASCLTYDPALIYLNISLRNIKDNMEGKFAFIRWHIPESLILLATSCLVYLDRGLLI